jgi:hypothetical protein
MANNLKLTPDEAGSLAHFVVYGQPGAPSTNRVLPTDWKTKPFVSPQTSPWSISIPSTQLPNLINGFKPREMEDKWFVCSEGPSAKGVLQVHFYRSWTGLRISTMEIQVETDGKGGRVEGLVWETSESVVKGQDLEGAKDGVREVCRWVLGIELGADE